MAKIQINNQWRIKSDNYCWHIQRYNGIDKKTGGESWRSIEYHANLDTVPRALARIAAKRSDCENFPEIANEVLAFVADLNHAANQVDLTFGELRLTIEPSDLPRHGLETS